MAGATAGPWTARKASTAPRGWAGERPASLAGLGEPVGRAGLGLSVLQLAPVQALAGPEFRRWIKDLERLGGCASPVLMVGHTRWRDGAGNVVHEFASADRPFRTLMVACRNRRSSVCPVCALLHNGDTYQIVSAGLSGGKGVPEQVRTHARVFATVTAPSFGPVHRECDAGRPWERCRPRRERPACPHSAPLWCTAQHREGDAQIGTPLCAKCYDYRGAVLWNAHAGTLWNRFIRQVWRETASWAGVRRSELVNDLRLSYVKVAEFQRRGLVHFHAVIRYDGPDGPGQRAPGWASAGLLAELVRKSVPAVSLSFTLPGGTRALRLGDQLDVREISRGLGEAEAIDAQAVGSYIAKYVTKGDPAGMVLPVRLRHAGQIEASPLSEHARRMMREAWALGEVDGAASLNTRMWAHQLGYRGNVATKSRRYSTTYGALRKARSEHAREAAGIAPVEGERESSWRFVGKGLTPELGEIAAGFAERTQMRHGPQPAWIPDSDE